MPQLLPGLEVPETEAISVPEQNTVTPQQADVESFRMTAGPVRKGLRSGFNQIGAMANAFVGSVTEAAGLTQFAKERMVDAEQQVLFADSVSPEVKDYRQVKDFNDLAEFVQGLVGQTAATMLPAVGGASVGRAAAGLRGAYGGAFAGSFVPNAGEQALRIRNSGASPQEKLGNVVTTGAGASALDMLVPGGVVAGVGRKAAKGSVTAAVGKNAALEGATEGVQEALGQAMHTAVEPGRDKSDDVPDIVNSAIAGAVGGGVLGGAGQVTSKAIGLIPDKEQSVDDVKTNLSKEDKPLDEFDDTDILSDPNLSTEADILDAIEQKGAKSVEALGKLWDRVKEEPGYQAFKDFREDPEVREKFIAKAKERFNELEVEPKIKRGFENIQKFVKGAKSELEKRVGKKSKASQQRTAVDFAIYDNMLKYFDEHLNKNLSSKQKIELADFVKFVAMYEHGKEVQTEGPGAPQTVNTGERQTTDTASVADGITKVEGPRPTFRRTIPEGMLQYFGENSVKLLNETNEILSKGGIAQPRKFDEDVKAHLAIEKRRDARFKEVVRANLRSEIAANPAAREEAADILAPRILDVVLRGTEQRTVKKGGIVDRPASEVARRFTFEQELDYAFGDNKERVLEYIDTMRKRVTVEPDTFFEEGIADDTSDGQEESTVGEETTEAQPERGKDEGPFGDKRLGVPIRGLAEAESTLRALEAEYDPRRVSFSIQQTEDGRYTVEAKDRIGEDSFSDKEWADIREPEEFGRSGLKNGILTVQLKDGRQNKINLVRLTRQMIRQTPRQDTGDVNYVYDMVSRGLSRLLADPMVKGLNKQTSEQIIGNSKTKEAARGGESDIDHPAWDLPDDTPVAVIGGRTYTWGDVKARVNISPTELRIRRITSNAVEQAQGAENVQEIHERILPFLDERISALEHDFTQAKIAAGKKGASQKVKNEASRIFGWLERVRGAKERVLDELDRRENEGDSPRHDIRGLVEDERIRSTTAAETPVGQRVVEGDTGRPVGEGGRKATPSTVRNKGSLTRPHSPYKPKQSTMNVGMNGPISDAERLQVKEFLSRILGPRAQVFFEQMAEAGSFAKIDGVETIRIAVNALDAMGVARHEAAHALISRLLEANPAMAQTLMSAAGSPTIITRLRTLLRDHPRALEQLSDPEERLAYMYQFWASGHLRVGPNTRTVFDKVRRFFRQIAGIWSETHANLRNVERTEDVFELFESGRLAADPDAISVILRDQFPKTAFENATELWPDAANFLSKVFLTADYRVRATNIAPFIDIADKMFTPVGQQDKGPGFLQTRYMVLNRFYNQLHDIIEPLSKEKHNETLNVLRSRGSSTDPDVQRAVTGIRTLLNDVFRYMDEKNVKTVVWNESSEQYEEHDLGFVENYFPRYYDRQKIFEDQEGFVNTLVNPNPQYGYEGMAREEAEGVLDKILRNIKVDPNENDYVAGLTYFDPNSQDRTLDVPDAVLSPWFHQDLTGSLYSYLNYAVRRGEYASRFGNQGQAIEAAVKQAEAQGASREDIKTFNQAVMAMEGSLGFDINPKMKQVLGGIVTYQNFRLLPLALFTSLVDPIGIAVRGGGLQEAFNAFVRGIRNIAKENKDEAYELAKLVGSISVSNDAHMLADAYGTQYLTNWQRKANEFLFKWNGMESWNRSMRVAATAAAQRFIIKHAGGFNEHSERYLRELGLSAEDVRIRDGSLVLNEKIKQAITQWVDGAILRPNAAIRPTWMSDPHWMVIAHLKQFTYSFQKTIVARVVHEMENGNYTPAYALLSYVPLIIASDLLRALLTPGGVDDEKLEKLGLGGIMWRGVQRAGLLGPGQYAVDAYGDLGHGKLPVASILGPTVQQLWDFGSTAAGYGNLGLEFKKAIPGYTYLR